MKEGVNHARITIVYYNYGKEKENIQYHCNHFIAYNVHYFLLFTAPKSVTVEFITI